MSKSNFECRVVVKQLKCFSCDLCASFFFSKQCIISHLQGHMRRNISKHDRTSKEKPYKCKQCKSSYLRIIHLNQHVRTEHEKQRISCHLCAASYTKRDHLNKHITKMHAHIGFKCNVCSKSFSLYRSLKQHIIAHQKNKEYPLALTHAVLHSLPNWV